MDRYSLYSLWGFNKVKNVYFASGESGLYTGVFFII